MAISVQDIGGTFPQDFKYRNTFGSNSLQLGKTLNLLVEVLMVKGSRVKVETVSIASFVH